MNRVKGNRENYRTGKLIIHTLHLTLVDGLKAGCWDRQDMLHPSCKQELYKNYDWELSLEEAICEAERLKTERD
jgi:hypothetical protein